MAEFLAGGDAHAALGAKGVSLFRMHQKTAAGAAIALANFIGLLAMGALRHVDLRRAKINSMKTQ
jgi:hypothetical protein